jgi:hypothetical protein
MATASSIQDILAFRYRPVKRATGMNTPLTVPIAGIRPQRDNMMRQRRHPPVPPSSSHAQAMIVATGHAVI